MNKEFVQHCPRCGRYVKIEGHSFGGYGELVYQYTKYFCTHCRLYFNVVRKELAFKTLKED